MAARSNLAGSPGASHGLRAVLLLLRHWTGLLASALAALVITALVGATGATAYWQSVGTGSATAATATLAPPTSVSVPSASSTSVPVTWTASAGTLTPAGYFITRTAGAGTVPACGSGPAALIAGTSCTDSAVPPGSYTYAATAVYRSWTAPGAASGNVVVQAASKVVFSVQPANVTAGAAIAPSVRVAVQTPLGAAVATANIQVALAIGSNPGAGTLSGTLTAYTDSAGVATFPGLSINKAGSGYTLAASSAGLASATSSAFNVTAAATGSLAITTTAVSGTASGAANLGPITVERRDAYGNLVTAGAASFPLSSNSAGASVFSATAGGAAVAALTIPDGSSSASFYYGDTRAASPTITVGSGAATTSQPATIAAGTASRLAITSTAVTAVASSAANSPAITVERQDAYGNRVTAGSASVQLSSNSAGTKIFSATAGGTAVTAVTIPTGSFSASFFYGDTKAGLSTITVSGTGFTPATQNAAIAAAAPSKLLFGQQPPANATKNVPFNPAVTVLIADTFGNQAASTATVSMSSQCNLKGTISQNAVAGMATFSNLYINVNASNCTLVASSSPLASATSNPFNNN